ncbi:mycofactocin biosynthesis chaperone MftB [Nocardia sp. NPDC003482]
MSTSPSETSSAATVFDPEKAWSVAAGVALRPEPFGALVYDFSTRKLSFLKSPELLRVVEALADAPSARAAITRVGIAANEQQRYLAALARMADSKMIIPRQPEVGPR